MSASHPLVSATLLGLLVHAPVHAQARPDHEQLASALALPLHSVDADGVRALRESGEVKRGQYLLVTDAGLSLINLQRGAPGPLYVDFTSGASEFRRLRGGGHGQAIARAVGKKSGQSLRVLDPTAGLGADAWQLASLGCELLLAERHPVVRALLRDGIERAALCDDAEVRAISTRMTLADGNGRTLMATRGAEVDVIYLDPMFPERRKSSAQSKKEMQYLQELVGEDEDADDLLPLAMSSGARRVVVKRPSSAPWLAERKPTHSLEGKSTRFDVYAVG